MKGNVNRNDIGATLIELMVVLVIASVILGLSVALFGRSTENLQRQNAAREFKNYLERARFDSVKRRASVPAQMSTVRILGETSYSYTLDLNQNGTIDDPSETVTISLGYLSNVMMTGANFVYPVTIRFDQRGQITAFNALNVAIEPLIYFCNGECTPETATAMNSNLVYVSPTGTVSMLFGGETVPTFTNPSVTAIPSGVNVNPRLSIYDGTTPPPLPEPSPTPVSSPLPSPSPVGSPTPSPSPVGSPTPASSPTPVSSPTPIPSPTPPPTCTKGQYVSSPCTCVSPMWVRNNGKCM